MKSWLVEAEVNEAYPDYTFMVRASSEPESIKLAQKELNSSYPAFIPCDFIIKEAQSLDDVEKFLCVN